MYMRSNWLIMFKFPISLLFLVDLFYQLLRGQQCICTYQLAWAAIAKCHRLSGLNNRNLFLTVLEAGSPVPKLASSS